MSAAKLPCVLALATLACACSKEVPEPETPVVVAAPELPPEPPREPLVVCPALAPEPFDVEQTDDDPPLVPIERSETLAPFFGKVAALLRGRARDHIRIAVYGDSILIEDYQTGEMRRRLQARFGDAGHGFVSVAQPWWRYRHRDVRHGSPHWTALAPSTNPTLDRLYGLAGLAAEPIGTPSSAFVQTAADDSPIGRTADTIELYYLPRPKARFELVLDGKKFAGGETTTSGNVAIRRIELDDAPHRLDIVPKSIVRVFGATLERRSASPSFVIDSFGVGALNTRAQALKDPELDTLMLRHRGYDLIVFHTGQNDGYFEPATATALAQIIAMHRRALPHTPILMLTPADRGKDDTPGFTKTAIAQRRTIASEQSLALWDLWTAMGGRRSMAHFRKRGFARSDYAHFNEKGGAWVGDRLLSALWKAFEQHLAAHPEAGCDDPAWLGDELYPE